MTGKVAEIRSLLNTDALADDIVNRYVQLDMQRLGKKEEWKELRKFIFATDTSTTSNSNLPWKNRTTIPKLCQIRDNLHAQYMSYLFSSPDWLKWEAYTAKDDDVKKAKIITSYMKNKLRESGFRKAISLTLYDYIDYGNCFGEAVFVNESKTTEDGENIPGYIGPKLIRNSPNNHVFDPTASDYNSSPKYTRYMKTIGELKYELSSRPDLDYIEDAITKAETYREALRGFKTEDIDQAEMYSVDGFGSLSEYYNSGYVEIMEFEGDIHDRDGRFYRDHIITIIDRKWVLRTKQNPSWFCGSNRAHVPWRKRQDNLYGMGPLDNLVGLQYRIDHLENLKADAYDQTIHPPKKIKGDVPPFDWEPDANIIIPDMDGDVELMAPNAAAFSVNNEIEYLQNLMEMMAGAPREAMGIRSPGEKTAYEVQALENAASRIFLEKVTQFEQEFLEPLLNMMFEIARRNFEGSDIVRVMDDDIAVNEFLTITKEDITSSGKLRPVGARHFSAQNKAIQDITNLSNSNLWVKIEPHVSSKKLSKIVEDMLGIDRFGLFEDNIGVIEQAETQRLVQQLSEDLQVEAMTPLEGEQDAVQQGL